MIDDLPPDIRLKLLLIVGLFCAETGVDAKKAGAFATRVCVLLQEYLNQPLTEAELLETMQILERSREQDKKPVN